MVLHLRIKRFVFLLWTISVFLLCAGSLINFHQNKIWGKPLNFELVAVKRDSKTSFKITSGENGSHGDFSMGSFIFADNDFAFAPTCNGTFRYGKTVVTGESIPLLYSALRGPPSII